jgi:hypothetical protein
MSLSGDETLQKRLAERAMNAKTKIIVLLRTRVWLAKLLECAAVVSFLRHGGAPERCEQVYSTHRQQRWGGYTK